MVTKEFLERRQRYVSGESEPLLLKNAKEIIVSIPVYSLHGSARFIVLTGTEHNGRYFEIGNFTVNEADCVGAVKSFSSFADFIKVQYDLGRAGECEFAGLVIIKKIDL